MKRRLKWKRNFTLSIIGLVFASQVEAAAVLNFGPLGSVLPVGDDGSSAEVQIGFPVNFFGQTFNTLFVNNNGNITFGAGLSTFTPFGLANTRIPIIAPFFADVDTRGGGAVSFGQSQFSDGTPAFVVNWSNVGYFNTHIDKQNIFQLILFPARPDPNDPSTAGDFGIWFNYDRVTWETGDASGGKDGLGGTSARAGFSAGTGDPGSFFEIRGSGLNGGFLNSNAATGLTRNRIPNVPPNPFGSYLFFVQNGKVTRADLGIALSANPKPAVLGADLQFTAFAKNFGRSGTNTLRIKFFLPTSVTFKSTVAGCTAAASGSGVVTCDFTGLSKGQTITVPVIVTANTTEKIEASVRVSGDIFDPNLGNNVTFANTNPNSCKGQFLGRTAPVSLAFEPTPTAAAVKIIAAEIENTGTRALEIVSFDPQSGQPFVITGTLPPLPFPISGNSVGSFQVRVERGAGQPPTEATAPYFTVRLRCG